MNVETNALIPEAPLSKLRDPFPRNQISKLPKETRAQIEARKADKSVMVFNCQICGGHHHKNAVHLDYVGHAALTDRLLDTDLAWDWQPVAFDENGLPARDRDGGLWIKLTVCGVTRYGYGAADGKEGGDAVKEIIGDALRNAAMRFGAALDLWHKGDLHAEDGDGNAASANLSGKHTKLEGPYPSPTALKGAIKAFAAALERMKDLGEFNAWMETDEVVELEKQAKRYLPNWWEDGIADQPEFEPMAVRIERKRRDLEQLENVNDEWKRDPVRAG